MLNPCAPALVWRSLVVYETTKHWQWKEGIINHFKLAVANTKGKRALAIIERAARVRIARRQTSRKAPAAYLSSSSVMPIDGGVAKPDEPIVKAPPPSPTRSRTRSPGTGRQANARSWRAQHPWWKVARSRARSACSKPLDVISRWASQNLDFFSLLAMPVLYVFTLTWSFERAFKGASLADLLSQLSQ